MKVGIITIHKSPNYGACLQAYALYEFLLGKGYDCEVIDLLRPTHKAFVDSKKYIPYRQKQSIIQKLKKGIRRTLLGHKTRKGLTEAAQLKFDDFFNRIKYSTTYYSIDELYANPPEYDVYITGSDQLWNPTIGFCIEPYFLTFVKNKGRKISYATSVGISELSATEKRDFAKWLSQYDAISVREQSARKTLSGLVSRKIEQVCDPSFLIKPEEWMKLSITPSTKAPYLLLFTLSYRQELLDFALKLKSESGMELIYLCLYHPVNENNDYVVEKNAGPREFLGYIANAEMVITDSFHGTVFSLILGAGNFFSYIPSTQKRGLRITNLLDTYHLSGHVLHDDLSLSYQDLVTKSISRSRILSVMGSERERSKEYLLRNLKNQAK